MADEIKNAELNEVAEDQGELTEDELDDDLYEDSSMVADSSTLEAVFTPQCVECPYNQGAIDCDIFGEKPTKYMANTEECPRQK